MLAQMPCLLSMLILTSVVTPSGRPPTGPLERFEPRIYDLRFGVQIYIVVQRYGEERSNYDLKDAPIVMPIIYQGTFSKTDPDSIRPALWLNNQGVDLSGSKRIDAGQPFNSHLAVIPVPEFRGQALNWQVEYRVQVWSSRIKDEKAAAAIPWPREWPQDVLDGLKPQKFIESDDPKFKQIVDRISQGKLREVPPYLAAKDLVRQTIAEFSISDSSTNRGTLGELQGMRVAGAKRSLEPKRPSNEERPYGVVDEPPFRTPHDLVCVCVAVLRAAGIPARPVVGIERDDRNRWDFVTWAEFYLPEAGWVPFDPRVMKGKGVHGRDVRQPIKEFGTMEDLNRRIPLAYGFIPTATVSVPENPAVWAWDPRPGGDPSSEQVVNISVASRGRGTEDPRPGAPSER